MLKKRTCKERKRSRPSGSVPLPRGPCPAWELLRKFRSLGLPPLLFPALQVGRIRGGGGWSQGAPGVVSREASSTPARPRSSERWGGGGSVSGHSSVARERTSVSSAPSGAGEGEVARPQRTPPASSVASPHSLQHARRHDESREVSEDRSIARSSRAS